MRLVIVVVGAVERHPIVQVSRLVVVVVRVVVVFPHILLCVDLVLVEITVHVNVRETVLQFGVIVIGNGSEGIEQVGVDLGCLGHNVPLLLLLLLLAVLHVRLHHVEVDAENSGVGK